MAASSSFNVMSTSPPCDEARAVLAASIAAGQAADGEDAAVRVAAMAHVAACPACQARLAGLAGAVLDRGDDPMPCAEARERLAASLPADGTNADDPRGRDPAIEAHLATCTACAGLFAELTADLLRLAEGSLPPPPSTPSFDTSFLHRTPPSASQSPATDAARPPQPAPVPAPLLPLTSGLTILSLALLLFVLAGLALWSARSADPEAPAVVAVTSVLPPQAPGSVPTPVARVHADATGRISGTASTASLVDQGATATTAGAFRAGQTATARRLARAATAPATRPPLPSATATPLPEPTATLVPTEWPTAEDEEPATPEALELRCTLSGGLGTGILVQPCDRFPARGGFDAYTFHVSERSRWQFSLCGGTEVNTLLALYAEGGFRAWAPCENVLAYDDDGCGEQSVVTVDLEPGGYVLLVSDKTGDAAGAYQLQVSTEPGVVSNLCPMAPP